MDDPLCCEICFEKFTSTSRVPMVARCGHTLCSTCLSIMCIPFCCPTCRVTSNEMAKNFTLCTIIGMNGVPTTADENKQPICKLPDTQHCVGEDFENPVTLQSLGLSKMMRVNSGMVLYQSRLIPDRSYKMTIKLGFLPLDSSTLPFYIDTCVDQNDVPFTYPSLTFRIATFTTHNIHTRILLQNIGNVRLVVRTSRTSGFRITECQCNVESITS